MSYFDTRNKTECDMNAEYADYLILGDEHHGEIYSGIKSTCLTVCSKYATNKTVSYHVNEYFAQDGRFYLVATNYPLSDFDIEDALVRYRVYPLPA
jgi:hypothetical protein